jgi:glycosyltransferase involved in cell wall biosynthesis
VSSSAPRTLTVGIDARAATEEGAGGGRVIRELLRALSAREDGHRYRCYAREAWGELDERFEWRLIKLADPWWHLRAAALAARECDVFLSNSYLTVCLTRTATVTLVYDLTTFDRTLRSNRRSTVVERLTLGLAVRRARAIVAISNATARDLEAHFPRAAGKVTVALLGVSPALGDTLSSAELAELPAPGFVLAVGTLEPRKNLVGLAAAYASLPVELQQLHPLVLAGRSGWRAGDTVKALDALGDRVIRLGYVSDAALSELYRRCAVFCYPSLGEGFGLPVLEAMAAGAAVVTSNVSSLPEVGGEAVEYVDARDPDSIATALRRVLEDRARLAELSTRAVRRAAEFSWSTFSATTLGVLERAAAARSATQP